MAPTILLRTAPYPSYQVPHSDILDKQPLRKVCHPSSFLSIRFLLSSAQFLTVLDFTTWLAKYLIAKLSVILFSTSSAEVPLGVNLPVAIQLRRSVPFFPADITNVNLLIDAFQSELSAFVWSTHVSAILRIEC